MLALKELHKQAKSLGLQVLWAKNKVQVFGGFLVEKMQAVYVCGENVKVLDGFTYLNSVVHSSRVYQGVLQLKNLANALNDLLSGVFGIVDTCAVEQRL